MHLAAVMGLVIEHMGDQHPARPRPFSLGGAGKIGLVGDEPPVVNLVGPVDHGLVEVFALGLQIVPVRIERHRFWNADRRPRQVGEAAHPVAVAPQNVAERLVDRAEPSAALKPALVVRQAVGDAIEILILPAIVTRHPLDVRAIDHGFAGRRTTDDRGRKISEPSSVVCRPSSVLCYASANLAWPTIASKVAGSVMARSESTLRSTMMPALLRPAMKRL